MVRLYLQAIGEGSDGITVKLAGTGSINPTTGRVTTVFEENPQLPFESVKLELVGGPRATLANPRACGPAVSEADLTPWSFAVRDRLYAEQRLRSDRLQPPTVQAVLHSRDDERPGRRFHPVYARLRAL